MFFLNLCHFVSRIFNLPQAIVKTNFGFQSVCATYPMKSFTFDFTVSTLRTAAAIRVVFSIDFYYVAVFIFFAEILLRTLYNICVFQTDFFARTKTEEFFRRVFHKIVSFNPNFTAELNSMCAAVFVLRIVSCRHLLHLTFGIIRDDKFHGVKNAGNSRGTGVKVFADRTFQKFKLV